jgi:hypothetical protein
MERCESCGRELAENWKFCIYCGRPMVRHTASDSILSTALLPGATLPAALQDQSVSVLASAIRSEAAEPKERKYDGPFWVGVAMGVLGLALIIYAAVQIYASNA